MNLTFEVEILDDPPTLSWGWSWDGHLSTGAVTSLSRDRMSAGGAGRVAHIIQQRMGKIIREVARDFGGELPGEAYHPGAARDELLD